MLTEYEKIRYQRQIMYSPLGEEGQNRLKAASVVVAGIGGLGSAVSIYLACAGLGHLKLIDCDTVDLSNLNRQILYNDGDIGKAKAIIAAEKVRHLNPGVEVSALTQPVTPSNAHETIRGASVVVDALDNFDTRFVLNDACVAEGIPLVHAGVYGLLGQLTTIVPGQTPCLACIIPARPRREGPLPVFGFTAGVMATLETAETIKLIAGFGKLLTGRLLYVNLETMDFRTITVSRRPDCPVCGHT